MFKRFIIIILTCNFQCIVKNDIIFIKTHLIHHLIKV